jgi:hypothetical protein
MVVTVVAVVDVRVLVLERPSRVRVHVRLRPFPTLVLVLVVLVMDVAMRVHPRLVMVAMRVPLAEQQPHPGRHQGGGQGELTGHGFAE